MFIELTFRLGQKLKVPDILKTATLRILMRADQIYSISVEISNKSDMNEFGARPALFTLWHEFHVCLSILLAIVKIFLNVSCVRKIKCATSLGTSTKVENCET